MTTEKAMLAGGSFWGMQDLIRRLPGVISTRVGYIGGDVPNATYRDHGSHAAPAPGWPGRVRAVEGSDRGRRLGQHHHGAGTPQYLEPRPPARGGRAPRTRVGQE